MKKMTFAIMFLFATFYTFSGLQAQMPGQVHGKATDQQVQRSEEQGDDEYATAKPVHRKDQAKENRGKGRQHRQDKGKAKSSGCNSGDAKAKGHGKAHQETGKRTGQLNKEDHGNTMKAGKEEMKSRKGDQPHPIFYRRADARNGKGEQR